MLGMYFTRSQQRMPAIVFLLCQ